ncbi:MAG: J domain-containing protein [Myxococcota bacterium]
MFALDESCAYVRAVMARLIQLALLIVIAYWFGRKFLRGLTEPSTPSGPPPVENRAPADLRDPHEVLEVKPGASEEEIRRAYQAQIRKYHPDYLENMAPELRELAEARTKEINRAYESLRRSG